jgi:uncharacterized protein
MTRFRFQQIHRPPTATLFSMKLVQPNSKKSPDLFPQKNYFLLHAAGRPWLTKTVPNRLLQEKSPYLLQHAQNPVDWFPWGPAAFAKAQEENKPIFLSIGYSTCHWCHVMEHESFENEAVAAVMNRHFINIKVDREERPDVDQLYMSFVQATTGHGGWPMSVWLTPDLKPFMGGTYFPPTDQAGRPGFITLLEKLAEIWNQEPAKVIQHSNGVLASLQQASATRTNPHDSLKQEWADTTYARFISSFDQENAGFGSAPKFPRPSVLNFLFRYGWQTGKKEGTEQACATLRRMASGGMYDHVGGGFHRYSVDARWQVPHFEKMLYDQAQLLVSCLEAYQITQDTFYAKIAEETFHYCFRDLQSPEGAFFSAEDADSLPHLSSARKLEGAFYAWTWDELQEILGQELFPEFQKVYEINEAGNVPPFLDPHGELHGLNVLTQNPQSQTNPAIASCLKKLFQKRQQRPRPHLDDKIITAWNGLMLSALAKGWAVLGHPEYLTKAEALASFLRQHLYLNESKTLLRSYRLGASNIPGFAEDYAFLIQGLLDLYEAAGNESYLIWAWELQEQQNERFLDKENGGYFRAAAGDPYVLVRMKDDYDGAEPSSNSISALNLSRLSDMLEKSSLRQEAGRLLRTWAQQMEHSGTTLPQLQVALLAYLNPPLQLILNGNLNHPLLQDFQKTSARIYLPNKLLLYLNQDSSFLKKNIPHLNTFSLSESPTAHLCHAFSCELPLTTAEALRALLLTKS